MKNPCIGCPKAGCGAYHDKCPQYQEYRADRHRIATRREAANDVESAMIVARIRIRGKGKR